MGWRSMKLNPFKPNLGEEHTREAKEIGQPAEGHVSLPECWPHIMSTLLLEIKTKILLVPLTGSQGGAGTSPSYLQARSRMRPGQVKHRGVNR